MTAPSLSEPLVFDRARLVRLCAYFSNDPQAAEDLAQETLVEAWRNAHKLHDPSGLEAWLAAIARNVCLRWARRTGQEFGRLAAEEPEAADPSDADDVEVELERGELAQLLDRALALLPAETRSVLIARYIHDSPLAEVAGRLGLTEGNVAVRLHRGKLALRRILNTELRPEAMAFGLINEALALQPTRLWCPLCGQRRLEGRLDAAAGDLLLRCPACYRDRGAYFRHTRGLPAILGGAQGFRVALKRVTAWSDRYLTEGLKHGAVACVYCGHSVRPKFKHSATAGPYLDLSCGHCPSVNTHALSNRLLATPAAQRFWSEHPRMRRLPDRLLEAEGAAAILTGWESVTSGARLELLVAQNTFDILRLVRKG